MAESTDQVLSLEVPCDRSAPATVRDALGRVEGLGPMRGDVILVASELVTNAVRHSGCAGDDRLSINATLAPDRLLISVHDPGILGQTAQPRVTEASELGGWGLRIVEELASQWGAERDRGYRIWAELQLAS